MMNRSTLLILLILTVLMTACGANAFNPARSASDASGNPTGGELSSAMQVAIGTLKLDGTENVVTAEQAQELLPLWETLQVLSESDTAAQQEKDALVEQIQETMTAEQRQAITDMNLTREDMLSILQEQGLATGGGPAGGQGNNLPGGNQNGGGFPGGFPGGGFPQGGFQGGPGGPGGGQGSGLTPDQIATAQASRQQTGSVLVPPALINALIEYLQEKVGA